METSQLGNARSISFIIRVVMGFLGLPLGITAFLMVSDWIDGGWGVALGIFAGLMVFGAMIQWGESISEKRLNRESETLFPNQTGEYRAAYWLVSLDTVFGKKAFQDKLRPTLVYDGGDCLFMRSGEDFGSASDSLESPRAVDFPALTRPWNVAKSDILALQMILFTDETTSRAGRDPRSTSDRVIEAGIGELMGHRVRHKITPFAALIELISQRDGAVERVVFAVPADAEFGRFKPEGWSEGSMEELVSSQAFTGLVAGQMAATSDTLESAADFVGDYGSESIGALSVLAEFGEDSPQTRKGIGNEGRKVALVLAEGLREIAGLDQIRVQEA